MLTSTGSAPAGRSDYENDDVRRAAADCRPAGVSVRTTGNESASKAGNFRLIRRVRDAADIIVGGDIRHVAGVTTH